MSKHPGLNIETIKEIVDLVPEAQILEGAANTVAVLVTARNGNKRVIEFTDMPNMSTAGEGQE